MIRMWLGLSIALVALMAPMAARAQGVDGTWKLSYVTGGTIEYDSAIIKINDGKGEFVALSPRGANLSLKSVVKVKNTLRIVMQAGTVEFVFEANVPAVAAQRVTGSMSIDGALYPASLETTTETTIPVGVRKLVCPPFDQAKKLSARVNQLRNQALFAKDAEKRKDLITQANEADQLAKKETPRLYREVLEKHIDSPAVFDAAVTLIKGASEAKPEDIKGWAMTAADAAKKYGPRYHAEFSGQLALALINHEGSTKLALEYARQAEKGLSATASATDQVRTLGVLARALRKIGENEEAKVVEARADKFETILDQEYSAKMPPFKGTAFKGREGSSERAVFMELFTGATCPPCVAADLAFDVLQKTYKASELVLLQYHMHIPGPDPMTNADSEARWAYYRKAYPKQVTGVPSSIFNGKPAASGGGGTTGAQDKYLAYRKVIEPLLEEAAGAKLAASAVRKGDRIDINVNVDFGAPGTDAKLRILLTEETVRYPGSNKIRLHHNVVRAAPGGVEGIALTEASSKHKASIELGALRGTLTKYLDNYEKNFRPFANPARPMDLNSLRVIAFVQDDSTHQILQAVMVDVERK